MRTMLKTLSLGLLFSSPTLAILHRSPRHAGFHLARTTNNTTTETECGRDAAPGNATCPLNVCCSEYGNCGTTANFCGSGCQNGCASPPRANCSTANPTMKRVVGYYESWASTRKCQSVAPKDLNATGFTHLDYAFQLFDPDTFAIAPASGSDPSLLAEFTDLKTTNEGLQTWVAVGGWDFNEAGPTATAFSNMVACQENRTRFINEITAFMQTYAFDGLDIDWEYPSASDRGGAPADKENLVALTRELRAAFGTRYGLSVTLPASYFYMKNFDPAAMQAHVDFFNVMTYDLHGVLDNATGGAGPYIRSHTDITEIDAAFDLLWRTGVASEKVNMGLAWYGRSFTLLEPNCTTPNGVCQFSGPGVKGPCSDVNGTLNLQEIEQYVADGRLNPTLNKTAAVKFVSYNDNQWVGYDDEETIGLKQAFARQRCLGGTMVWAMDQADQKSACGLPEAVRPASNGSSVPLTGQNSTTASNCSSMQASSNTTCSSILTLPGANFTTAQLKAWNPSIKSWDPVSPGQSICLSPPGGWYELAAPPLPAPGASNSPTDASTTVGADKPSKTQAGIAPDCSSFATAVAGDTCIAFAAAHGVEAEQFYAWNPALGADGADCATNFWAEESYCIGAGTGVVGSNASSVVAMPVETGDGGETTTAIPLSSSGDSWPSGDVGGVTLTTTVTVFSMSIATTSSAI